jgi:hypothetical protein
MKEIKFACPGCGQHIACDRDYADMCIVCPACNQPMEVPRLITSEAVHSEACIVASIPTPKQRFASRIPTIDLWTENEWDERYRAANTEPQQTPAWVVSALGTLIAAAVLKAGLAPGWAVVLCVLAGSALSCYLLAENRTLTNASPGLSTAGGVATLVLKIGLVLLAIPVLALGVLFIGCACSQ